MATTTPQLKIRITAEDLLSQRLGAIGKSISALNKQFSATSRVSAQISQQFDTMRNPLNGIASSIQSAFAAVSVPIAAASAAMLSSAADFEESMTTAKVMTNATNEQFERLETTAKSLARTTIYTAPEVAKAMESLAGAGFSIPQILSGTDKVLDFASAAEMDPGSAAMTAGDILNGFQKGFDDLRAQNAVLTKGFSVSAASMTDLAESLRKVGSTANLAGMDLTRTTALLAAASNTGLKGDVAATGLAAVIRGLIAPTSEKIKTFKSMGIKKDDLMTKEGKVKDIYSIFELFEKKGFTPREYQKVFEEMGLPFANAMRSIGVDKIRQMERYFAETEDRANIRDSFDGLSNIDSRLQGSLTVSEQAGKEALEMGVTQADFEDTEKGLKKLDELRKKYGDKKVNMLFTTNLAEIDKIIAQRALAKKYRIPVELFASKDTLSKGIDEFKNLKIPLPDLQAAFGENRAKLISSMMSLGDKEFNFETDQVVKQDPTEKLAEERAETFWGKLKQIRAAYTALADDFSKLKIFDNGQTDIMTKVKQVATQLSDKIKEISASPEKMQNLINTAKNIGLALAGVWLAAKTLSTALFFAEVYVKLPLLVGGIKGIGLAAAGAVKPILGMAAAFAATPLGWLTLIAAGVIAIGVVVHKNRDTIRDFLISSGQGIQDFFGNVKSRMAEIFGSARDGIASFFGAMKTEILAVLGGPLLNLVKVYDKLTGSSLAASVEQAVKVTQEKDKQRQENQQRERLIEVWRKSTNDFERAVPFSKKIESLGIPAEKTITASALKTPSLPPNSNRWEKFMVWLGGGDTQPAKQKPVLKEEISHNFSMPDTVKLDPRTRFPAPEVNLKTPPQNPLDLKIPQPKVPPVNVPPPTVPPVTFPQLLQPMGNMSAPAPVPGEQGSTLPAPQGNNQQPQKPFPELSFRSLDQLRMPEFSRGLGDPLPLKNVEKPREVPEPGMGSIKVEFSNAPKGTRISSLEARRIELSANLGVMA